MEILTVTGYKPMEINVFNESDKRIDIIKYAFKRKLTPFIEEGLSWVILSGQLGVELWVAEVVLDLKEEYDIQLGVFPPFENYTSRWPEHLQNKFTEISFTADHFQPLYKGDYKGPYQFRAKNEWFVNKSDASLILMDEEFPGSTKYYYDVAKKRDDHDVYLITPFELDEIVEEMRLLNMDEFTE